MLYLCIIFVGIFIGTLCRRFSVMKKLDRSISYTIWIMLFVFGISIGANRQLVDNLQSIGMQALVMAVCGIIGSVLAAGLAYRILLKKKGGRYEK
ncbi:LysO family transporter [uncultured Bacteroides sp.]|uniref:LysO family transporter n=1 Tax=uncultured Bacteroides sp. TaxID=162156 RepID=UPI00261BB87F|nr:LysO family transporter [uncultured Bacteroides sp.]